MNKSTRRRALVIGCVVAAVFLSRVWLILIAGSDVPFWDQWGGEALRIYKPFLEGTLHFKDLFGPHNEHRIVFTHLLNLSLLKVNGQWDPLVQMIAGSAIQSVTAGIVTAFLLHVTRGFERLALVAVMLAIFCLPFGWQNTLWAFQSTAYFLILFSLVSMGFLGLGSSRVKDWIAGLVFAGAALFSMGSAAALGLALAALGLVVARDAGRMRRGLLICAAGLLVFAVVSITTPRVSGHAAFRATDPAQFLALLASTISWPLVWTPALFLVADLPLILLVSGRLLRRIRPDTLQDAAILLGAWAAAIGAGFAFYRGGIETDSLVPASRYFDFLCFLVPANALAIVALVRNWKTRSTALRVLPGAAWGVAVAVGLAMITWSSWTNIIRPRIDHPHLRTLLVTELERTGDPTVFDKYPSAVLPSPDVAPVLRTVEDPSLAPILPPSIHPGIPLHFEDGKDAVFTHTGFFQPGPPPGYYPMFTSFAGAGSQRTGTGTSAPFQVTSGGIELTIAAALPEGCGSVSLVDEARGDAIPLMTPGETLKGWKTVRRHVPDGTYRLKAESTRADGWFAFSLPRPVGPLSFLVRWMQPHSKWFLVLASFAGLAALVLACLRNAPPDVLQGDQA